MAGKGSCRDDALGKALDPLTHRMAERIGALFRTPLCLSAFRAPILRDDFTGLNMVPKPSQH